MTFPLSAFGLALFAVNPPGHARADELPTGAAVISEVHPDLNGDGFDDRAVLVKGKEGADLYVFLSKKDPAKKDTTQGLALVKKAVIFHGDNAGQEAELATNAKGSLILKSQNDSVGRDRWEQTLTVAYRKGELVIIGVSYAARDTLDPSGGGKCDLNLATRKGKRNGRTTKVETGPIRLADWSDERMPKACRF